MGIAVKGHLGPICKVLTTKELLWQASLPGAEVAFTPAARLRRVGRIQQANLYTSALRRNK